VAQKFTVPITVKQLASAGSDAVTVYVDQDTFSRLKVEAGGRLTWGSGASAGDVNLYRDSADVLKTDDTFKTPALFVDNIEIDTTGATTTQALVFNGVKFVPGDVAASGGASLTVSDTAPTSPEVGDLWFNSTNARTYVYYDSSWVEVGASGGVASLDDIGDVSASAAISGDLIQYNGSSWVNVPSSTVGATTLDGLSDVVVTSPFQFQGLMYDGTNWVNSNIPDVYLVRNNTGSTILKGTLVGAVGAEPSGRIDVAPFEVTGTEDSELRAMGIAASNISNGVNGEVMSFGTLTGLDTRGSTASALAVGDETWAAGDILFAHPTVNGKLTNVRPQHDLAVAFITVRHASAGQIAIRIIPGNNHLEWMHDVSLVDKVSGDFLKYNGTLWVNDQINLGTDTVGDYVSSVTAGTGISVDFTPSEGAGASVSLNATLDDLSNVSVATPNTNDVLTYNGSAWTAASAGGGSTVTASTTPPSSPESGSIWFDSSTAKTYVYYDSFWVEIGGTSGGAKMYVSETAPSTPLEGQLWFNSDTAQTFAYYDSFWVEVGAAGMAAIAADAAPASPVTGQIWFNTSTGATYVYYDSYWIEVGAVAANTVFNLVDAKGDLLVGTADNTLARQAVGTNGQLLQANSSATNGVEWVTPAYAPTAGPTFTGTVVLPSTTSIGTVTSTEIGYVDGVTSAIQTQLNAKAPLANPTFTGTVSGITSTMVGLGNVNNTADTAKPVSTAQQTALNLKANLASPTFTGNVTQDFTHGIVSRLRLPAVANGAATGECSMHMWISEPAATWTGCGIARNRINTSGSFPRVNTGLSGQYMRFDEGGNTFFACMNSVGSEAIFVFDPGGTASKSGGGSWAVYSDIRLKENVRAYEKGTAELMQLRVCEWEHNGKGGLQVGSKGLGVVADEVELILPNTVSTFASKLNPEDEETTDIKRFDSSEITWLLVKTVQEQQALIEQLTARIEALEA
jgi:hypothetical protein